ncbi:hypothetical protein PGH12_03130 [Chryseobacterium wangxinyae]|uniref:hypothetical protein n=1 Tax=Chryseobacterium sp. CY350 TaxID=2997336 RepID=UPI002271E2BC|nr:hypothetical protein [Chryseobacterium sp. CY350]MCY0978372.1 hypothetical protein [Chryseobacterium sp. CY350]WBZ96149.1 hypothetical protein PGH12_03130 [Chryseobacterium sp. CY350]
MRSTFFILLIFIGISAMAQQSDKEAYIKKESIGGKLDFTKKVDAKYKDNALITFGDTAYNKKDFAILLWAANVRNLDVNSVDQAINIWEQIYKRSLTDPEKKALHTGFEAKF